MDHERRVPAGEFKATCLKLMEEVRRGGGPIVITKRGKPIAKLVPAVEAPRQVFGCLKGTVTIHGDITEPTGEVWNAERGILYIGEEDDRG
jgi:prevent-host-death family protein